MLLCWHYHKISSKLHSSLICLHKISWNVPDFCMKFSNCPGMSLSFEVKCPRKIAKLYWNVLECPGILCKNNGGHHDVCVYPSVFGMCVVMCCIVYEGMCMSMHVCVCISKMYEEWKRLHLNCTNKLNTWTWRK